MAKAQDTRISALAKSGLLTNNTLFMQTLGLCPALAVTTTALNGIGMGVSTAAILMFSNLLISLLRNFIPKQVRIASYIVVIAGFVTMLEMFLKAFIPALDKSLGLFIPLIVTNCIILAKAEAFASKNGPVKSVLDGIFTGLGFAGALFILASVREIAGAGAFMGLQIFPEEFALKFIVTPAGAFISLGILTAVFSMILKAAEKKTKEAETATATQKGQEAEK